MAENAALDRWAGVFPASLCPWVAACDVKEGRKFWSIAFKRLKIRIVPCPEILCLVVVSARLRSCSWLDKNAS